MTSDWFATHSTAASANAGLDQDMPGTEGEFGSALPSAVSSGAVSTATLNSMVTPVLTEMFGYGLFASTLVPALAIGLNWAGATRAGAIASIVTGLVITLAGETAAHYKVYSLPAGVAWSGVSLVASALVFFAVSWMTRLRAAAELDEDVRLVMEM